MGDKAIALEKYIPLTAFISEVCGKNFEVILHDVSTPESSILAIHNGHISGRSVGDPITDLAMSLIRDKIHIEKDYICNYEGRSKSGKTFVSSTFFIKDGGELIGLICINHDVTDLREIQRRLSNVMDAFSLLSKDRQAAYTETLEGSIRSLSDNLIRDTISHFPISPGHMTPEEKIEVIQSLEQQGVFETKGAVNLVAKELSISEPTVYRYLKKIK